MDVKSVTVYQWFCGLNNFLSLRMCYAVWSFIGANGQTTTFAFLQGSVATVLVDKTTDVYVAKFLRDAVRQILLKLANVSRSYSKNTSDTCSRSTVQFSMAGWRCTLLPWKQTPAEEVPPTSDAQRAEAPPGVVEAYRAKVKAERQQLQQQQQQQQTTLEADSSYRRAESDYSIDNLSQLFNTGDDSTPRYFIGRHYLNYFETLWAQSHRKPFVLQTSR